MSVIGKRVKMGGSSFQSCLILRCGSFNSSLSESVDEESIP